LSKNVQIIMHKFYFYLLVTNAEGEQLKRNCSTTLKPLLNLISAQGKVAQSIVEQEQTPIKLVTSSIEITSCDLMHFREDIAEDHNPFQSENDKH